MSVSVGIDIGSFSVKVAEVEGSAKGFRLLRFKEFPLSQDPSKDKHIEVIDILRNLAHNYESSRPHFVIGIPQNKVSTRRLQFPFRERHKIVKTLAAELEDQMPFSQDSTFYDAKITHFMGPRAQVIATSCPRANVERYLQVAIDGDIDLTILSVEGLALANLFEDWSSSPKERPFVDDSEKIPGATPAELVLDLGHDNTLALIYREGFLLDVRSFDWGGKNIADAISKKYKVHYIEALKELRQKSYVLTTPQGATKDQIAFSNVIGEEIETFCRHLNLMLLELKSQYQINIEKAHLVGGLARLKNIGAFLTQKIEIAANRLKNPPLYPSISLEPSEGENISALAVGLALEGLKKPINPPTNFLQYELAKKSQNFKLFWDKWGYATQLAAGFFVAFFIYAMARESMTFDMSERVKTVLSNQGQNIAKTKRLADIQRFIKQQERTAAVREDAEALNLITPAIDVLRLLSGATPKKDQVTLNVKRFTVQDYSVRVTGEVRTANQLPALERAYQGIADGSKIRKIAAPENVTAGWTGFGYEFTVKRIEGVTK